MSTLLQLRVQSKETIAPLQFPAKRVYNLGFTIRDAAKMKAHLDEVAKEGVPPPHTDNPPIIFPISSWATVTSDEITVQYDKTSGEIEIVTLVLDDEMYVGVGSDHTDRALEAANIPWSKQVTPNVLAPTVWRWNDVADHWDAVQMESYVTENGTTKLYQKVGVAEFWTPLEMRDSLKGRVIPVTDGGMILFSGTVVSVDHQLNYGREWTLRMIDAVLGRQIEHTYRVVVLNDEILVP
jgi:4-hydroxyphenylacetate 3-monooxygenase